DVVVAVADQLIIEATAGHVGVVLQGVGSVAGRATGRQVDLHPVGREEVTHHVEPGPAVHGVVSPLVDERVVAVTAVQGVVARTTADDVVATETVDHVVAPETGDDVVVRRAVDHVVARRADDGGLHVVARDRRRRRGRGGHGRRVVQNGKKRCRQHNGGRGG